jgi:hypothetical protein
VKASPLAYVSSALSLAAFIGDLFAYNLLPVSQIHMCLSLLVGDLSSVEHVHAIHLLILHAGSGAWGVHDEDVFVKNFSQLAHEADLCGGVEGREFDWANSCGDVGVSLVGRAVHEGEVAAWVCEIGGMMQRWKMKRHSSKLDRRLTGCAFPKSVDEALDGAEVY